MDSLNHIQGRLFSDSSKIADYVNGELGIPKLGFERDPLKIFSALLHDPTDPAAEKSKIFWLVFSSLDKFFKANSHNFKIEPDANLAAIVSHLNFSEAFPVIVKRFDDLINPLGIWRDSLSNDEQSSSKTNDIIGGMKNMIATYAGIVRGLPELIARDTKKFYTSIDEFKEEVKAASQTLLQVLLSMAKMQLPVFFKFLNLRNNHFPSSPRSSYSSYIFRQNDFGLSHEDSKIKINKESLDELIASVKNDPSVHSYGKANTINLKEPAIGCPAIYIRTSDNKQNMIEVIFEELNSFTCENFFDHLDNWFTVKDGKAFVKRVDSSSESSSKVESQPTMVL